MKVALVSDPHSNFIALQQLESHLARVDKVVCLGDFCGYYTQPNEVIEFFRKVDALCVLGNHDYFVMNGCPEDLPEAVRWGISYSRQHLSVSNRRWLEALPTTWGGVLGGRHALFVHGSPQDPLHSYLYQDNPELLSLDHFRFDLIAFGQTHRAMLREQSRPVLVNPGSIGQSRDSRAQACMALWDTESQTIQMVRESYDPRPVVEAARAAGASDWIGKHLL